MLRLVVITNGPEVAPVGVCKTICVSLELIIVAFLFEILTFTRSEKPEPRIVTVAVVPIGVDVGDILINRTR